MSDYTYSKPKFLKEVTEKDYDKNITNHAHNSMTNPLQGSHIHTCCTNDCQKNKLIFHPESFNWVSE